MPQLETACRGNGPSGKPSSPGARGQVSVPGRVWQEVWGRVLIFKVQSWPGGVQVAGRGSGKRDRLSNRFSYIAEVKTTHANAVGDRLWSRQFQRTDKRLGALAGRTCARAWRWKAPSHPPHGESSGVRRRHPTGRRGRGTERPAGCPQPRRWRSRETGQGQGPGPGPGRGLESAARGEVLPASTLRCSWLFV